MSTGCERREVYAAFVLNHCIWLARALSETCLELRTRSPPSPSIPLFKKGFIIGLTAVKVLCIYTTNLGSINRHYVPSSIFSTFHMRLNSCSHMASFALCSFSYRNKLFTKYHLKRHFEKN